MAELVPYLTWKQMHELISEQIEEYRSINSGVHISLVGTTRGGKTTLVTGGGNENRGILSHFENVLVLDTTADPGALSDYGKPLNKYGKIKGKRRLTIRVPMNMSTVVPYEDKMKVYRAISRAAGQGDVAIYADEVRQLTHKAFFGLEAALTHVWLFGAKQGTSLIGGTQAPVWVPGSFYDQAKLHFLFHVRDVYRLKRLAEIGGNTKLLQEVIARLKRWEFAHVGIDGDIYTSKFALTKPAQSQQKTVQVRREQRFAVTRAT